MLGEEAEDLGIAGDHLGRVLLESAHEAGAVEPREENRVPTVKKAGRESIGDPDHRVQRPQRVAGLGPGRRRLEILQ